MSKKILKGDTIVWIVFLLLSITSIIALFSASSILTSYRQSIVAPIIRHIIFLLIGIIGILLIQRLKFSLIAKFSGVALGFTIIFLLATKFLGFTVNEANRQLAIGGFQFQPSEFAKFALIVFVADWVNRNDSIEKQKASSWILYLITLTVCGLILIENLSTAVLLFFVITVMLVLGQVDWKVIAKLIGISSSIVVLIFSVAIIVPKENVSSSSSIGKMYYKAFGRAYVWVDRIKEFGKNSDENDSKYVITDKNQQVQYAKIAIARGGILGLGPGNSVERNILPDAFGDYIFAIILEEYGMFGCVIIIMLYLTLFFRVGIIVRRCPDAFTALVVSGAATMITLQALIHVSVSVGLGPVTGQPLPLISNGGTSIITVCGYFGLILSASEQTKETSSIDA